MPTATRSTPRMEIARSTQLKAVPIDHDLGRDLDHFSDHSERALEELAVPERHDCSLARRPARTAAASRSASGTKWE